MEAEKSFRDGNLEKAREYLDGAYNSYEMDGESVPYDLSRGL